MYKTNQIQKQGYCLICLKSLYRNNSVAYLLNPNKIICMSCASKFKQINKKEIIDGVMTLFLYEYNHFMKNILYQYKGCYDIVLKDVFLNEHINHINKKYKKFTIIYPPSNIDEQNARGFNHIELMCDKLTLKKIEMFYKNSKTKQANTPFIYRNKIEKVIEIKEDITIKKTGKYLIIDDVYTSGHTLKSIIKKLVNNGVKKENIKAIIVAKTAEFVEL